jgi:ankyrin repeat protein
MLERTDRQGRTALWHAAISADGQAVQLLLNAGAAIGESKPAASPLMAAVRSGDPDSVQRLLRHGAPANPTDPSAVTPLMASRAAGCGRTDRCFDRSRSADRPAGCRGRYRADRRCPRWSRRSMPGAAAHRRRRTTAQSRSPERARRSAPERLYGCRQHAEVRGLRGIRRSP